MRRRTICALRRRELLKGLVGAALLPIGCERPPRRLFASAQGDTDETFSLVVVDERGVACEIRSSFRGHGLAQNPIARESTIMFGRRPATECLVVDIDEGVARGRLVCPASRRFQGHGCFSADGAFVFATEADVVTADGKLGIYRADTLARIDELDTYGKEPHEVALLPDGSTLVVANGGLVTHAGSSETPENLDTMDSTLALVDARTGVRVSEHRVPEPKASIRHLAVTREGAIVFGMQVQREAMARDDAVPLVSVLRLGASIAPLVVDEGLTRAMKDYVGSVAVCAATGVAATSSPRGDLVLFFDVGSGEEIGHHAFADVCGIAVDEARATFWLAGSGGRVRAIDAHTLVEREGARRAFEPLRFDNHLLALGG
jgi:hypothetical protein